MLLKLMCFSVALAEDDSSSLLQVNNKAIARHDATQAPAEILSLVQAVKESSQGLEQVVKKKSKADKKAAEKTKVKAVDSGKESPEEAKAEEKAAVKSGVISAEEAKKDEKKVDKATAAKRKKKVAAAPAADLIDIPDDDGILSLVQASQGMFLDSDNICVTASKGDQAPFNGQFNGREVASGTVAMESGTFCVDQSVLALVQRSWGLSSAQELEQVVKKKTKEEQEEAAKEEKKVDKKVAKAKGKEAKKKVVKEEEKKEEKAAKKKKKKAVALVQRSLGLSSAVRRRVYCSGSWVTPGSIECILEQNITKLQEDLKLATTQMDLKNKKMKELIDSELNKKVGDLDAKMEEQLKNLKVEAKTTVKVLKHLLDQHN